jgi:hypothetical protein
MIGNATGINEYNAAASVWQTPHATVLTSASDAFGADNSTSSNDNRPGLWVTNANTFIVFRML